MNIVKLASTDSDTERLLKGSVLLQAEVNAHKKTALQRDTALMHLSNFLDEFEGKWDSDEQCTSIEHAQQYIDAAKWAKQYFGREDGRHIYLVEEWILDQLCPKPRHPRDYDFI